MATEVPDRPWNVGVRGEEVLPLINLDAPVIRVAAGPGTGKTFGLTRRVLRLTHPAGAGVDGADILVVAFNRVIAADLRQAIDRELSSASIESEPVVSTVHALCQKLLGDEASRMLLPHEVEAMLYDVRTRHSQFESLPFDDLAQRLRDHEAGHVLDHALAQAVDGWLALHSARLVGDLPTALRTRLHGGDVEDATFAHVVVDEFQDLTATEQAVVTSLVRPGGTLLALGDPRQSIYAFRGNDRYGLSRLEELSDEKVVDIPMVTCQRCPPAVVKAANALMSLEGDPMKPASGMSANVHLVHWDSPAAEASGMAQHIVDNWERHPSESHLVMVTRRRLGYLLRDAIKKVRDDVAVDLSFSESLLEEWQVREAFLVFCLLVDPDPATWRAWFSYTADETCPKAPVRNSPAYLRFLDSCADRRIEVADVVRLAGEERTVQRGVGGAALWDRARRFLVLRELFEDHAGSPREFVDRCLGADQWLDVEDEAAGDGALVDLELLRSGARASLVEIQHEHAQLSDTEHLRLVARALRYRIATREPFDTAEGGGIQITTLWGSKGLTALHVYLLGLCDEALPGERPPGYPNDIDLFEAEQRRLFYVSITRTKETLVLSQIKKVARTEGKRLGLALRPNAGWYPQLTTSRFLEPILQYLPRSRRGEDWSGCGMT